MDHSEFSKRLALIHAAPDEEQTLDRVLAFAMETLNCDMAGVMVVTKGTIESVAVTQPMVTTADNLQFSTNEGPCLSAIREQDNFRIDSTDTDPRFPQWGPLVADLGIHSVLSVRMASIADDSVGSLNLYASRASAFNAEDIDLASILTHHAAVAYLNARKMTAMTRAIDTRTVIGQAEGILMDRFGIDPDQAFSVLRRYSQHHNQPLRDVARELVATRKLPEHADEIAS